MVLAYCQQAYSQLYAPLGTVGSSLNDNIGIDQNSPESKLHIKGINCRPYTFGEQSFPGISSPSHIKLESVEQDCGPGYITNPPPIFNPAPFQSQWWDINGGISSGLRFKTSYDNSNYIDLLNLHETNATLYSDQFSVKDYFQVNATSLNITGLLQIDANAFNLNGFLHASQNNFIAGNILSANSNILNYRNIFSIDGDGVLYKNSIGAGVFYVSNTGLVRAREIFVDLLTNIPDYVFNPSYPLMPLDQLEKYIETNKHLPGIKSEKEFQATGAMNIGEMNVKLLEKVEELTLYVIELKKEIAEVKSKGGKYESK